MQIRPINEARMTARWKLGQALSKVERGAGPGRGKKKASKVQSFLKYIKALGLGRNPATEAQRIGTLPEEDLLKKFASNRDLDTLTTASAVVALARRHQTTPRSRRGRLRDAGGGLVTVGGSSPIQTQRPNQPGGRKIVVALALKPLAAGWYPRNACDRNLRTRPDIPRVTCGC